MPVLPERCKVIGIEEFIVATKEQEVLKGFEPQHLEQLAALAKEVRFTRDQIIFHEGEDHGFFYLIVDGSVVLEIVAAGRSVMLQTLHAGDAMGWSALIDTTGDGAHFEARALSPVKALAFEGPRLRETCEEDPAFGYRMMKSLVGLLTERLDATRMQVVDMYAPQGAARG
ncbi:MAG TPA: cyclic nucleotide-binding domain-containing protein [Bryobacteraceae bacterium]|nr:cyclic nucleotide-binding domain-containing protein [Bryobacteraceae bacterium]